MKNALLKAAGLVGALLMAGFLLNCSQDDGGAESPQPEVPKLSELMIFTGLAEGEAEGVHITCYCDLRLELKDTIFNTDGSQSYNANLGGEITRVVLNDDGDGFSFSPFLFGEAQVRVEKDSSVSISWPGNLDTGIRFYDEIAMFEGVLNADGSVSGMWNCAPLDLDQGGYVDLKGTVAGNWGMAKAE